MKSAKASTSSPSSSGSATVSNGAPVQLITPSAVLQGFSKCPAFGSFELLPPSPANLRSEEHTSALQSHRDLPSSPTRRASDLGAPVQLITPSAVLQGFSKCPAFGSFELLPPSPANL